MEDPAEGDDVRPASGKGPPPVDHRQREEGEEEDMNHCRTCLYFGVDPELVERDQGGHADCYADPPRVVTMMRAGVVGANQIMMPEPGSLRPTVHADDIACRHYEGMTHAES